MARHIRYLTLFTALIATPFAFAERVRDLASIAGVRANQLVGYGLVVGLDGSGDQTSQAPFTVQGIINMLTQFGVTVPPGTRLQLKKRAFFSSPSGKHSHTSWQRLCIPVS